jgi:hypothetical protein
VADRLGVFFQVWRVRGDGRLPHAAENISVGRKRVVRVRVPA